MKLPQGAGWDILHAVRLKGYSVSERQNANLQPRSEESFVTICGDNCHISSLPKRIARALRRAPAKKGKAAVTGLLSDHSGPREWDDVFFSVSELCTLPVPRLFSQISMKTEATGWHKWEQQHQECKNSKRQQGSNKANPTQTPQKQIVKCAGPGFHDDWAEITVQQKQCTDLHCRQQKEHFPFLILVHVLPRDQNFL